MLTLLFVFFAVSIVFSFLCSMWEAVLLSITPAYAEIEYQRGSPLGKRLRDFKRDIDRPLSAILTLNTIAHTVGAIGVGAQAAKIWSETNPLVTQLVVPTLMTLAILVLSEIIPKTLGAVHWKRLAGFTVRSLSIVMMALAPLVWMSQGITRLLKRDAEGSVLSRSDFLAMARLGAKQGVFEETESEIISNLLRFERVTAKAIMTPRTVAVMAPETQSVAAFLEARPDLGYSRIPLHEEGSSDRLTGFVLKHEVLEKMVAGEGATPLADLRRNLMIIPEDYPLPELFSEFLARREHIAAVVDEFGGMAGLVTTEDVIETLLGLEIVDESDEADDLQAHAREQWRQRAKARGVLLESSESNTDS